MLDDVTPQASGDAPRCTWCSAPLPSADAAACPSCGATLIGEGDPNVPGLTAIDADAILRAARAAKARPRSRLMSWISGEYVEGSGDSPAAEGSLAPPSDDVRREMLRLELQAQVANLQAEAEAMAADAAVESGEMIEVPDMAAVVDEVAAGIEVEVDEQGQPTDVRAIETAEAALDEVAESEAERREAPPA